MPKFNKAKCDALVAKRLKAMESMTPEQIHKRRTAYFNRRRRIENVMCELQVQVDRMFQIYCGLGWTLDALDEKRKS